MLRSAARRCIAGRERARYWKQQWYRKRRRLDAATVVDEICASYAAEQLGIAHPEIRARSRGRSRALLAAGAAGFRSALGSHPSRCSGRLRVRRIQRARAAPVSKCRRQLAARSRYEAWYVALIKIYFCERWGLRLPVGYSDVMSLLPLLQPYPRPGSRHYRDAIYAVTHIVYTLQRLQPLTMPARLVRRERAFLEASMSWAIGRGEADTVGEIVDSLAGCGVADTDPLMMKGRAFILEQQRADGGWGDARRRLRAIPLGVDLHRRIERLPMAWQRRHRFAPYNLPEVSCAD